MNAVKAYIQTALRIAEEQIKVGSNTLELGQLILYLHWALEELVNDD
jgi:hypothetical protein